MILWASFKATLLNTFLRGFFDVFFVFLCFSSVLNSKSMWFGTGWALKKRWKKWWIQSSTPATSPDLLRRWCRPLRQRFADPGQFFGSFEWWNSRGSSKFDDLMSVSIFTCCQKKSCSMFFTLFTVLWWVYTVYPILRQTQLETWIYAWDFIRNPGLLCFRPWVFEAPADDKHQPEAWLQMAGISIL